MSQVVLHSLRKTFPAAAGSPPFDAVRGIDLTIESGELMVLVGPSGCGKSTTLRMIAGLEEISGGSVLIDGRVVNDVAPKDRDIAMVFQNYALYPHMTVYDNMAFGLQIRRMPKGEIAQRVGETAALLGLQDVLARKPKQLSGGQRQRVAVGRAIVRKPKVFLLDEPLSNLDAKLRVSMRGEISLLHSRLGATMIYVTHDQTEAMTLGDRICVMRDGEIEQVDRPLALYRHPSNAYVAGFIGSPPMNLLRGNLESRDGRTHFITTSCELPLPSRLAARGTRAPNREVLLGIRPEHFALGSIPDSPGITAQVELAEPMGAETHLHLRSSGEPIIARITTDETFDPGTELQITPDLDQAHLFDAASGHAID